LAVHEPPGVKSGRDEPGGTSVPYPGHTTEKIARRGQELHERKIHREVEPEHDGRFLVVDVKSGDYEIADDDLSASDGMLARRPDAMLYGLLVGRDYAYRLGGGP
jgi:hypothetical protein